MLVLGQTYQVFNSEGVLIGYIDVPRGMALFNFDVMGNLIELGEDSESGSETVPPVDNNPITGVVSGFAIVIPAFLTAVITGRRRKK